MVVIKKPIAKAYVLLESLIGLILLGMLVSLVLGSINDIRRERKILLKRSEVLNTGQMALDSGVNLLEVNGVKVEVIKDSKSILVKDKSGEVGDLYIEVKD